MPCIKWSQQELDYLDLWHGQYTPEQISRKLKSKGYERSVYAVTHQISKLGISCKTCIDNLSCSQAARLLNLHSTSVNHWCLTGRIKAKRRKLSSKSLKNQPTKRQPHWLIRRRDLIEFLKNPPPKTRIARTNIQQALFILEG